MEAPSVLGVDETEAVRADPVELLRALYPRLLGSARGLGLGQRSEDLVQQALVETLLAHPRFEGLEHPVGYVRAVLFRLAFSRRRQVREVPADVSERLEHEPDPSDRVEERLRLEGALAELGPKQRACLTLRYLHGLDESAIAAALGCRPSTVRSQTTRALARMRALLEEEES